MTALDDYFAFTEKNAQKIEATSRLVPRALGASSRWVPLTDMAHGLVETAMISNTGNPKAASSPKHWRRKR